MAKHIPGAANCKSHTASRGLLGKPCKQAATFLLTVAALSCAAHVAALDPALGIIPNIQTAAVYDDASTDTKQYIPRIIHQSYLPNEAALDRLSTAPRSHFRRDWRRSCQVHNPEFQYMFWNETRALSFVTENYPDMLPYYNKASKIVLKSDILRIMILDKLGGVWLDIDTECFSPVEPILRGFHLVAQAEWSYQLCNSHIAGVPGHPVWRRLMDWFIKKVEAGEQNPLKHTGPVALTTVVKEHIQPANPDRNMSAIAGAWVDPNYSSKFRAYGLQQEWFLPCKWASSYMSPCQGALARSKAIVRQLTNGVNVSLALLQQPHVNPKLQKLVKEAQTYSKIRGSHEYSNSWTTWKFSDGLKTMVRAQEAIQGLMPFFSTPALFEEYKGWVTGGCGTSETDLLAMSHHQLCGAVLRQAAQQHACHILSIRGRRDQQGGPNVSLPLTMEQFAGQQYGCKVTVVTLQPRKEAEVSGTVTVREEPLQLGPVYDQYSFPPTLTLTQLLESILRPSQNLTLLHIDCGADCSLWDVLNQQQLTGSLILRRVGSLLVDLGTLPPRKRHMINTVYQHLYQEVGFVGYSWGKSLRAGRSRVKDADAAMAVVRRRQLLGEPDSVDHEDVAHMHEEDHVSSSRRRMAAHVHDSEVDDGTLDVEEAGSGRGLQQMSSRKGEWILPSVRLGFARVL